MSFQFFRRFFHEIHLWLGIASGIILFIVCLSGSIFVFREEVQRLAEPDRYYVEIPEGKTVLSADELIAGVETAKPGMKVASITIPEKPNRTVSMNMVDPNQSQGGPGGPGGGGAERGSRPEGNREGMGERDRPEGERRQRPEGRNEAGPGSPARQGGSTAAASERSRNGSPQQGGGGGHGGRGGNAVYVDPYTGNIVGEGANKVDPFFMSMMQLHRWLWFSGEWRWIGKMIVGIATIIFVVICVTGVVLWLPRTWKSFTKWRAWKPGLRIRFSKGIWPLLYDTHNTIGFYLLIPALILALTGLCWSFRWYNQGLGSMLGLDGPALQRGGGSVATFVPPEYPSAKPLSVERMIELQNELTPGPGEIVVSIPQSGNVSQRGEENGEERSRQAMSIQKGRTGFFALAFKDRTQWDYYRGEVIPVEYYGKTVEVERFSDRPLRNQIAGSIRAIHFGNITGLSSKIFFFVVCLFATSWPLTGAILWTRKLLARRRKKKSTKETVLHIPSKDTKEESDTPDYQLTA